ncbi:MAG: pyridoxal phosphate-dependent aminotransferase [Clostridiales bacterium]|nr:pyridoxal phosphate-dependent aminotransferase [Clostridiales bacterium]
MNLSKKALQIKPSKTLTLLEMANKMNSAGDDIIVFVAGEPDFYTFDNVKEAAINAINDNFTRYTPGAGIDELRRAVSDKLRLENGLDYGYEQIVISNGSKQALLNAFMAILDPDEEVIIPSPYWASYPEIVKLAGGKPVIVKTEKENCFKVTKDMLEDAFSEKTKAIILNSPCNPSGMVYSFKELQMIADFAEERDIFIVSDELYEKFIYSGKLAHTSIATLGKNIYNRTIVVNGVSKSYAMTGWRVGYSAAAKEISDVIANIQSHSTSNVNSVAQKAALAALTGSQENLTEMVTEFKHRRDYIAQRVSDIPLLSSLLPKGAFYLFVDISKMCGMEVFGVKINNANDISKILLDKYKVAVVPCESFGFENYIRLSYAISMENIVNGIDRIEKFVKENF